jgi:hypothetical protein
MSKKDGRRIKLLQEKTKKYQELAIEVLRTKLHFGISM